MRNRIALAAAAAAGLFSLTAVPASAAPADGTPTGPAATGAGEACADVKLSGALPVPPPGMAVRQQVTIGPDCTPVLGPARLVSKAGPKTEAAATSAAAGSTAAGAVTSGTRQVRSRSEMYDCCNIRMTGLYTTSSWDADGTTVTAVSTDATQEWNREPWNAGWSLESSGKSTDCLTDCAVSHNEAHAEFSYQGLFDPSGDWYANTHHSYVTLNADGTASCRFDVELKHSFIGWNWQRGCE
ncbi:hypothetical protein [Streptomyces peucetius]|uniref:Secreted protein n=1 Tax=Streptomyces peucetius TaxID=1950 RepID=A0ABY6ICW6_STRPE|nr:hypothetical protein [Streptomyces peucetius]UYQ64842.1 hypothetical protein OGH68_27540 [Streptomyces peucetius]